MLTLMLKDNKERRWIAIAVMLLTSPSYAQWNPSGALTNIPVVANCTMTGGDIAVAWLGIIYYCPVAVQRINSLVPDAGHFYFVHEYGHLAIPTSSEPEADCWAATQLRMVSNGVYYVRQWITFWSSYGQAHPKYGTVAQRIANVRACCSCGL